MTRRKGSAACVLLLMGMMVLTGMASAASILENASQIAQVVSPPGNTGSFPISSMLVVKAKGQLEPIPMPLPENQVFIVTRIIGYFIADNPNLNDLTTFNLGDYYRTSPVLTNGFWSFTDGITPGIPITNLGATVYLHLEADSTKTPIPGKLNLRVMGYTANIN
jgi:hypothetical protein